MSPVAILILGSALLGGALWALVSWVDPRRPAQGERAEPASRADRRRLIRLLGILFAGALILFLATALYQ